MRRTGVSLLRALCRFCGIVGGVNLYFAAALKAPRCLSCFKAAVSRGIWFYGNNLFYFRSLLAVAEVCILSLLASYYGAIKERLTGGQTFMLDRAAFLPESFFVRAAAAKAVIWRTAYFSEVFLGGLRRGK